MMYVSMFDNIQNCNMCNIVYVRNDNDCLNLYKYSNMPIQYKYHSSSLLLVTVPGTIRYYVKSYGRIDSHTCHYSMTVRGILLQHKVVKLSSFAHSLRILQILLLRSLKLKTYFHFTLCCNIVSHLLIVYLVLFLPD